MKNACLFISFQFVFLISLGQSQKKAIKNIDKDSAEFFMNGYMHLEGKIGNANASMELNVFPGEMPFKAYLFCDSLNAIYGFMGKYSKGKIILYYNDYLFVGGSKTIYEIDTEIQKDSSLKGVVVTDTIGTKIDCWFKETYTPAKILFRNLNFSYNSIINKFPVELYGNLLFADTITKTGNSINQKLLNWYDELGGNVQDEVEKINFKDFDYLKTRKTYRAYCLNKFKRICNKVITREFVVDAKGGHDDIFRNGLNAEVLVNDGQYIVLQLISRFADGTGYPYYDTKILQYDVESNKVVNIPTAYQFKDAEVDIDERVNKLKQAKLYTFTKDNEMPYDDWFIGSTEVAFATQKGYVLLRRGGNHGIHQFYKFYPKKFMKSFFKTNKS